METTNTAVEGTALMPDYGPVNLWRQSDGISHAVMIILLIMSILSWTQIVIKSWRAMRRRRISLAMEKFWEESSVEKGIKQLDAVGSSTFLELAKQARNASRHLEEHGQKTLSDSVDRGEFITRTLRQSIVRSTAWLESGLTLLASIGSIAPFIGLFGTVWGIYHALLSIAASGAATLNKVSGPVGEALIMTAAGLFVAIPAVIAYNAFTRLNRLELMELDGFAHDLHAYLNTGARVKSKSSVSPKAAAVKSLHLVDKPEKGSK